MANVIVLFEVTIKNGKMDYTITVATPVRSYTRNNRKEAPADSNQYFSTEA